MFINQCYINYRSFTILQINQIIHLIKLVLKFNIHLTVIEFRFINQLILLSYSCALNKLIQQILVTSPQRVHAMFIQQI